MRLSVALLTVCGCLTAVPATAQGPGSALYRIELDQRRPLVSARDRQGKPALFITVQFQIVQTADGRLATDVARDEIVVEEDQRRVTELEIHQPAMLDPLTVVLALDISGSMANQGKMDAAKRAARLFLDTLHAKADCGLILFDHEMRVVEAPAGDPRRSAGHRNLLRERIESAQPHGGTAYLDATARAITLLQGVPGRKAVLLMTDGVDLNSRHKLDEVIDQARKGQVQVYTLGIGEPGKQEPVTTVLVLDHSGSMNAKADDDSDIPKIVALQRAAGRFVDLMRPRSKLVPNSGAVTTLLPFSTTVAKPTPFTDDKTALKARINQLQPDGETALFDATYTGIETLEAARLPGKRAVVVLTDGIDNSSRRRVDEVIDRARAARTAVHMLGLGRAGELDEKVMRALAQLTGGEYHHAQNEEKLFQIFEDLSIQLHDDGIDQDALEQMAAATGGQFYHARDASKLHLYYQELAHELQSTYTATFPSRRPSHDGTARGIDISVMRNGLRVSQVARLDYHVHGVVVPTMNRSVYLILLALLGALLLLPVGVRRMYRFYGGT